MPTFDKATVALPAIMWKQPDEVLDRAVDFAARLNSAGVTVGGVTAMELPSEADATAAIIATSPAPLVQPGTKIIQFRVQGGDAGKQYRITVQADGDDGQVAEFDIDLYVEDF